jgi:hypothetical protein
MPAVYPGRRKKDQFTNRNHYPIKENPLESPSSLTIYHHYSFSC